MSSATDPAISAPAGEEQDAADMGRLAAGHDPALNNLMERHGERLFHYLVRCLQNETEATELAQEAFVRVYQHRKEFRLTGKFSTWLYTIAANLVRSRYRFRTRHPEVSLDAENEATGQSFAENLPAQVATPSERLQAHERAEAVRHAIAALPEELRAPLILFEYEDRSHADIAAILRCSPKAVEMRLYRARHQLRQRLAKLLETP